MSRDVSKEAERYLFRVVSLVPRRVEDKEPERKELELEAKREWARERDKGRQEQKVKDYELRRPETYSMEQQVKTFRILRDTVGAGGRASKVEDIALHFDTNGRVEDNLEVGDEVLSFLDTLGQANLHTLRLGNIEFAAFLAGKDNDRIKNWKRLETLVISCDGSSSQIQLWDAVKTFSNGATRHLRIESFPFARWLFNTDMMNETLCRNLVTFKLSLSTNGAYPTEMHEFWPCGWLTREGMTTTFDNLKYLEIDESLCRLVSVAPCSMRHRLTLCGSPIRLSRKERRRTTLVHWHGEQTAQVYSVWNGNFLSTTSTFSRNVKSNPRPCLQSSWKSPSTTSLSSNTWNA